MGRVGKNGFRAKRTQVSFSRGLQEKRDRGKKTRLIKKRKKSNDGLGNFIRWTSRAERKRQKTAITGREHTDR